MQCELAVHTLGVCSSVDGICVYAVDGGRLYLVLRIDRLAPEWAASWWVDGVVFEQLDDLVEGANVDCLEPLGAVETIFRVGSCGFYTW